MAGIANMSRRHYELIARVLRETKPRYTDTSKAGAAAYIAADEQWKRTLNRFMNDLQGTNPQFDAFKFEDAAKGEK